MTQRVVMVTAGQIAQDYRVRKTALAVAATGREVTLVYGDHELTETVEGTLDGVRTIGVPMPYLVFNARRARWQARRNWRPRWPGYGSYEERAAASLITNTALLRSEYEDNAARRSAYIKRRIYGVRARFYRVANRFLRRYWKAWDAWIGGVRVRGNWRRILANVVDIEAAMLPVLADLDADIFHLHDVHLLSVGEHLKKRYRADGRDIPIIYDAHEFIPQLAGGDERANRAYEAMEGDIIRMMDAVITVSDPIADELRSYYDLPERPTVTLNSPPSDSVVRSASDVRAATGVAEGVPLMVYSGVLGLLRNLPALVDSLESLTDVHLAIVCVPGVDALPAIRLAERAAELGVSERLHLVPPVKPEEIISFLSTADLGVHPMVTGLPNHEMALPNKLFDYVFAGLPIAVSQVREMSRFVAERGVGATFDPDDPADIARAVREVLSDLSRFTAAAQSADLKAEYSWQAQAARIAALYEHILSEETDQA